MASIIESNKVLCIICNKSKGIFKCEGCSRIFCPKHSIDHRNELGKQLEQIEVTHDLVQQILIQQTEGSKQHLLLKTIDQWEQESIVKIRQAAEEARNELLKYTAHHTNQVKKNLQLIFNDIKEGRENNDFSESELQQWTQKLEELKIELHNPINVSIQQDSIPLVTKIRIDYQDTSMHPQLNRPISDVFERVCGNAQIEENGCLILKDDSTGHTEIRGKNQYNIGKHKFYFRIEQLASSGWIFFGIISKSEPMQYDSFYSPSSYGWSSKNQIYIGGDDEEYDENTEIFENDTIILLIDCDQKKILLQNNRLNRTRELLVDIKKCPFPWQLHLNLHAPNTHVRILNSSN
ncbi:unnamed protein product [Rotaria sordida]|uniref:B box-type domain-containing protein n=1 Tax=Rotaria sordida TaxID=392033 RepID=A0A814A523_9BILA|nr:unnamed protein product [Rotaria sordida]CAF1085540.1 unnamed protein product [Rotaria sordida]